MNGLMAGLAALLTFATLACHAISAEPAGEENLASQVAELIPDLAADDAATRNDARQKLLALGGATADQGEQLLDELPTPTEQMPAAVRESLTSIRKTIADRLAKLAASESRVTLNFVQAPLEDILADIEKQTGNRLVDLRKQFGQQADGRLLTIEIEDAPFWEAIDLLLDEAGLGVYAYSGEAALGIVGRQPGAAPRSAAAAYAGPLRIEAVRIVATRNLRQASGKSLNVLLEIAWEPRLTPIAMSQPLADVTAKTESDTPLSMAQPEQSIDIETSTGAQTAELTLPMVLPSRDTTLIQTLAGKLHAIVPGRTAEFRFDQLTDIKEPIKQTEGGATVTLNSVRKNNEIWELHMRLKLDKAGDAFASHRGWVFNNLTWLEDKDGKQIEHAGFETTMQQGGEIGLAYLFDLPDGPKGLTWVYRSPTAILRFPVEYELNHIPLP